MTTNKYKVTIEIDNPEGVAHDLADLLCWWEGFKMGLKTGDINHFIIAEHGIDQARELRQLIQVQINK